MRSQEVALFSRALQQVIHLHEDTRTLQVQVDVSVDERVSAKFVACVRILQVELSDSRSIVGGIILCKLTHIGSHFNAQYLLGQSEPDVQVVIEYKFRQGKHGLVAGLLVGDFIV